MERSLPENMLLYANENNAKRHQSNGYQPERPVADAIRVEDKKAKRSEDDSLSPYIYYATEPEDEDPPSV